MIHSETELREILNRALDALEEGKRSHIYRRHPQTSRRMAYHLDRDLERLSTCCRDFPVTKEQTYWEIITECLEAALEDPLGTYKCPQEPICSHDEALGVEMFAFVVELPDFTKPIYTKFCLVELEDGALYASIRCHT